MRFINSIILTIFILFTGCEQSTSGKSLKLKFKQDMRYNNKGFSLIYNENLNLKKLDDRSLQIFHKTLKNKSFVLITNPINNKSLIAQVMSNKIKFSNFYNSVITARIVEALKLNPDEPYIDISLISKNSTYVAKKAKTFDEEKEIAEKAPIDGIKISNLNDRSKNENKKIKKDKFSYSIKVADFYYKKTANLMIDRIKTETLITDIKLIELSKTNYRVLLGPFSDINNLRESFEKLNSIYFENLEILKNV